MIVLETQTAGDQTTVWYRRTWKKSSTVLGTAREGFLLVRARPVFLPWTWTARVEELYVVEEDAVAA